MYEARISFEDGRKHTVEANNLEMIKNKCRRYIESDLVYEIVVVKIEGVGFLKSLFNVDLL